MAIRKIIQLGDETLRKKSFEVPEINAKVIQLLDDMKDTLKKAKGAGLAAVQVGVLKRIFIVDVEEGYFEFINPEIVATKGEQFDVEGCLSVPGKWGDVKRPYEVTVKALDRYGEPFTLVAKGFFAKAICHENDHLDGIVYVDKAKNLRSEVN